MSYNGWTNYETWSVVSWINEGEFTEDIDAMVTGAASEWQLAEMMKAYFQGIQPITDGLWGHLLAASLSEVDWNRVAESHWLDPEDEEQCD